MTKTFRTIEFPIYLDGFDDYHELDVVTDTLRALGVNDVNHYELEYDDSYRGIFYITRDAAFDALVVKHTN